MDHVKDLLRTADPVRDDAAPSAEERLRMRRAVLASVSGRRASESARPAVRRSLLAAVALFLVAIAALGANGWLRGGATLHAAAVRFEVRLAAPAFSPGLTEARIAGSNDVVYLHQEAIVTNDDISDSHVIAGDSPSNFGVAVTFNAAGAEKMRQATAAHVGELMAILIDGQVVMAPRLRAQIGGSAVITGTFTQAEAERIASGMRVR